MQLGVPVLFAKHKGQTASIHSGCQIVGPLKNSRLVGLSFRIDDPAHFLVDLKTRRQANLEMFTSCRTIFPPYKVAREFEVMLPATMRACDPNPCARPFLGNCSGHRTLR